MNRITRTLVYLLWSFFLALHAQAALVVESGELAGATDILVGDELYIVTFRDDTCAALFLGCNDDSDFVFHTPEEAVIASQALVDQVFINGPLGDFDADPELLIGCEWIVACTILTPYEFRPPSPFGEFFGAAVATNWHDLPGASPDDTAYTSLNIDADLTTYGSWTYAVWKPKKVPEPPSALTVGLLLGILTMFRRRQAAGNGMHSPRRDHQRSRADE